jgi:deoxyadenosine/deoxycytidine kinase
MKIVWIHGAPAAGKLTVAKELKEKYGFKLLHNHLAVDLSLSIYDEFGAKDFHEFTDSIRRLTLQKAKEIGVEHVVMTWVVCSKLHQKEIQGYLDFFEQEQIDFYPVHLSPSKSELLLRVESEERKPTHKISCANQLSNYLEQCEYAPIKTSKTIKIDNTNVAPEHVAERIMSHIS